MVCKNYLRCFAPNLTTNILIYSHWLNILESLLKKIPFTNNVYNIQHHTSIIHKEGLHRAQYTDNARSPHLTAYKKENIVSSSIRDKWLLMVENKTTRKGHFLVLFFLFFCWHYKSLPILLYDKHCLTSFRLHFRYFIWLR